MISATKCACISLVLVLPDPAFSQSLDGKRQIRALRLTESNAVVFDGRLDEPFWQLADSATGFRMQEPREGAPASERTVVRIAFDSHTLYIAAVLYDSQPSQIKAFLKRRDLPLFSDDRFTWILDTFNNQRSAYFMEVNPNGMRTDGLVSTGQGESISLAWDGIWDARTHIGEFGWSVEVKIPFRSLNFDPDGTAWGVNFLRAIRRNNETVLWTGFKRNQGLERPQDAGMLTGLSGLSQGIGLEVVPYAIIERSEDHLAGTASQSSIDGGFDVSYSITPGLKASVTVNTDFAETEVDERLINLTRFPLQFPEQRDFFLEGSTIYQFAPASGVDPFFSRRIGLSDESREPVPISFGGRLLGNHGNYDVALLHVRTAKSGDVNREDFTVARLKRNVGEESTIGLIYTRRSTDEGNRLDTPVQDRYTVGADLELGTSRFADDKNLQFQAFAIYHNPSSPSDDTTDVWDRSTRGIRLNFPNQPWSGHVSYREFGTAYNPAVGFNRRNGFRRVNPRVGFAPQFENSRTIQEIEWSVWFEHLTDLDFKTLTQQIRVGLFNIRFTSGDEVELTLVRAFERLNDTFDIKGDGEIVIPAGNYRTWEVESSAATARFRKASFETRYVTGGFWSGTRQELSVEATLRPAAGFELSPEYVRTNVDLKEGDFSTNLFRFSGTFDLSTSLFISTTIQYDDLSELLGVNNRLRWIPRPGTDVFLVYNHNWIRPESRFESRQSSGTVKISYTHWF